MGYNVSQQLVTVATFLYLTEAEVCKILLEDSGILAVLADAETVNANAFLGNAVGYIKLKVPPDQVEAAIALVEQIRTKVRKADSSGSDSDVCLSCGTEMKD